VTDQDHRRFHGGQAWFAQRGGWQRHSARIIRTPIGTLVQWGESDFGISL
jgi:hypothetical protein